MIKRLIGALLAVAVLGAGAWAGYQVYTNGGTGLQAASVTKIAVTRAGRRVESPSRAAIDEALAAVRWNRVLRPLNWLRSGGRCGTQQVGFLTGQGWVWVEVKCPNGFFLDFL
ncbi:MAG TPA: hypothetical protein VK464_27650 [Symbiobacteriaceae bacterium]|jgi:hypothetical protein|nr:hypothetical protein [Symbiobacteriaceae bacterium]